MSLNERVIERGNEEKPNREKGNRESVFECFIEILRKNMTITNKNEYFTNEIVARGLKEESVRGNSCFNNFCRLTGKDN